MLVLWVIPVFGIILALIGLAFGLNSYVNFKGEMARAGIFLNSLGLGLSLLNITVTLYLLIFGELDPALILEQME